MANENTFDTELVSSIIKNLRTSISNLRIYPAGSQIIISIIEKLYNGINDYLKTKNSLTISESKNKMLIDGQDAKTITDPFILSLMMQHEIQSITFKKGIQSAELSGFLELMAKSRHRSSQIIEDLKSMKIANIDLDKVKYVAIIDGEEIVNKVSSMVDSLADDPMKFMTSLRDIYDNLDTIKDDQTKNSMISLLSKKLALLEPAQLRDFFDRTLPAKIEESGLKQAVITALPEENIKVMFEDIKGWYDDIKRTTTDEFEAAEKLKGLRNLVNKILNAPAAKNIPFRFFEELLRVGVLTEFPEWVKKDQESSLTFKVDEIMKKTSLELLDPAIRNNIPDLIKQLCLSELADIAQKIIDKLLENIKQPQLKVRSDTMIVLMQIFDIVAISQKESILTILQKHFMEAIEKENNIDIYENLLELLSKRVVQLLLNGRYDEVVSIIGVFKQRINPRIELDIDKRNLANEYFLKLAGEMNSILINDIKSGVDKRQTNAMKIIMLMEDTMSEVLIKTIKETDDYRIRKISAQILKSLGEKAVAYFIENINLNISTDSLRRVTDILDEFCDMPIIDKLKPLIEYPDISIKKKLLKCIMGYKSVESKNLILSLIHDKDIGAEAIKIAGENKFIEALDELIKLAQHKNPATQEVACLALGLMEDSKALPVLITIAVPKKTLFGVKYAAAETVRLRAVWSLRKFPTKEVTGILQGLAGDKSNTVRSVAKQSLEEINRPKQPSAL